MEGVDEVVVVSVREVNGASLVHQNGDDGRPKVLLRDHVLVGQGGERRQLAVLTQSRDELLQAVHFAVRQQDMCQRTERRAQTVGILYS
mgnify:CR=1 FL=1